VEPSQEQQDEQICPNLDAQSTLGGADEVLDLQVLLESLEEELDLPSLAVNLSAGGRTEAQMVGDQDELSLLFFVPDDDSAQQPWTALARPVTGEADDLVGPDGAMSGQATAL